MLAVMPRRERDLTTALIVLAALVAVAWLVWPRRAEPPPAPAGAPTTTPERPGTHDPASAGGHAPKPDGPVDDRVVADGTDTRPRLRVWLRGLVPAVPWTGELIVDLRGRPPGEGESRDRKVTLVPDAEGRASVVIPDWWPGSERQRGRVSATDPRYADASIALPEPFDPAEEVVLDVHAIRFLTGRVFDPAGAPVPHTRLVAFADEGGEPAPGALHEGGTDADGRFRVEVPFAAPVWLLAAPMLRRGNRWMVVPPYGVDDNGELRDDLLPQARRCLPGDDAAIEFVLLASAPLVGTVTWRDGAPVALASVRGTPVGGRALPIGKQAAVHWLPGGGVAPAATLECNDDGVFSLPSLPGTALRVEVVSVHEGTLVGPSPSATAAAPAAASLVLPRPIVLRAVRDGQPVAMASFRFDGHEKVLTSARSGDLDCVVLAPMQATAQDGRGISAPRRVAPEHGGQRIDLELSARLGALEVEFDGDAPVRNATFAWRDDRGSWREQVLLRDDRSGPFRVHLPPGEQTLRVTAAPGERNGVYLLPIERTVTIGPEPRPLVLPARFGGTFVVHARDANGVPVTGTCRVFDADGRPLDGEAKADPGDDPYARPGAMRWQGVLPAGAYDVEVTLPTGATRRTRIRITPRHTTDLRLRFSE